MASVENMSRPLSPHRANTGGLTSQL